uniref:AAA+ ATPase domain-containing protein n=1 Tax=Ditylenchus dipsaci TaxID=166011 RepID=A0A915ENK7_9BILA
MSDVEETIKRIQSQKGVTGVIIMDSIGRAIRSTLDDEATSQYSALLQQLCDKSKSVIKEMDATNDLTFLRLRTKKNEIMIAPTRNISLLLFIKSVKMSWIFGIKQQQQPGVPQSGGGQPADSNDEKSKAELERSKMAYSFDSTALERAATAARTLENSSNAKQALELARLQEVTRQKEHDLSTKQVEARIAAMQAENARAIEEERRKTLGEETKHAKHRADYQDQLARKRAAEELAAKERMQQESLRKQEESIKKQEQLRIATIERELQLRHKYDLERINAEVQAKARAARENKDVNLEMMKASQEEHRKTVVEQIKTTGSILGAGLQDFLTDRTKMVATVGGLTALAIGWYSAKRGTSLGAKYIEARLGKPSLVRETSRLSFFEMFKHPINSVKQVFKRNEDPLKGVVLNPSLESRLRDVAITTKNTKRNLGLFRNVLFYGPPGTGKTMFAKSLARHSGLDYAIMTGGDVAPMGQEGVSAIHKIFDWAETSRKGLVLFIDEGDAFLRKRSTEHISEHMRAMLNAFLYRTGEQSRKFMLIVASNQPEQFDWAVNDRLDELVEFGLPGDMERERILLQYFNQYIAEPATSGAKKQRLKLADFDWIQKMKEIAARTKGMSGRELSKLVVGWQASAYASEDGVLTVKMIDDNTRETMKQHRRKMNWLAAEQTIISKQGGSPLHELKTETITEQRIWETMLEFCC